MIQQRNDLKVIRIMAQDGRKEKVFTRARHQHSRRRAVDADVKAHASVDDTRYSPTPRLKLIACADADAWDQADEFANTP
jgi:hypothetical protein